MKSINEIIVENCKDAQAGIFIGRLNPMHQGHQAVISGMIEAFGSRHLVLIGSCNHPISIRHLFNFADRLDFITEVFSDSVKVAPLPDFDDNATWFRALDSMIELAGINPQKAVYFGDFKEDVEFYYENGRNVQIINRYSGPTVKVSASEIRDALITGRTKTLEVMVDPRIIELLLSRFTLRWNEVRQK